MWIEWKIVQGFSKNKKEKKNIRRRVSQLISRLSVYYRLPVVEKCLENCLVGRTVGSESTTFGWVWPVVPHVQLDIAGFFNHQYLWKESSVILNFQHGVNHQAKVASKNTTFCWARPVVPLTKSDCKILWSSMSQERVNWYPTFLYEDSHQEEVAFETTTFI